MNRRICSLAIAALAGLAACSSNPDEVSIQLFKAAPDTVELGQSTQLVFVVTPPAAKVSIDGIGDLTGQTATTVTPTVTTTYQLTAVNGTAMSQQTVTVTVGPQLAGSLKVEPATATPTAGVPVAVTLTALTASGKTATDFRGTVHLVATDVQAVLPPDATFIATDAGVKTVMVTFKTAGPQPLLASQTGSSLPGGSTTVRVQPAAATTYRLSGLPTNAAAGESVLLTIAAIDPFGNVDTNYAGSVQVTSTDATDILPPASAFTSGQRTVSLSFTTEGNHSVTVSDVASAIASVSSSSVVIGAAAPLRFAITAADPATTAGNAESFTARLTDLFGNTVIGYRGTVHFAATDAQAGVPADFTFTAGDAGKHTFSTTLKTAGLQTLTIRDTVLTNITGANNWSVSPAAAASCATSQAPSSVPAGSIVGVAVTVHDPFNNIATGYTGTVALTATDPNATLPPATAFQAVDSGSHVFSAQLVTAGSQTLTATDAANPQITCTANVTVGAGAPLRFAITAVDPATTAGNAEAFTARLTDLFGNTIPVYLGTVHFTATDPQADVPADFTFTVADAGKHTFNTTLRTAGLQTLTIRDTVLANITGANNWSVSPAAAASCATSQAPNSVLAGSVLGVAVTVRDPFNNVATGYTGTVALTATDPGATLPPAFTFQPLDAGNHVFSTQLFTAGSQTVTAADPANPLIVCTASIAVSPAAAKLILVSAVNPATVAGSTEPFTARLTDLFGNTVTSYAGTVHFASTDPQAIVPGDFTFGAADAGVHAFSATLKTSGIQAVTLSDAVASLSGATSWAVSPAAAASCTASQPAGSAVAGSLLNVAVNVHDAFNNLATDYTGTVALTATDPRATLPPAVTFLPFADAGSHVFSAQLITTGTQMLTATDAANPAIQCAAAIIITPAAPKLLVTMPSDANAGYPVSVSVAVKDLFDNSIPTFTGTVSFTSTDGGTGAATPAPIVFAGGEGGVATTSATFVTIGQQTLAASNGTGATASALAAVHGLVFTAPDTGRVRFVANATSNAQIIQLDLIANERLEVSSFFGGGPGSFAAGMNLPIDVSRVGADATLFTAGNALPLGTGTPAAIGKIGNNGILYTAVSRKRVAGAIFSQETEVAAGKVFYSVRLKLQPLARPGPIFDGAQPSPQFRAAVRDQYGDDFVNQGDFGVGKLEVR